MAEKPVLIKIHEAEGGKIMQITLNRPEVHNACNGEMAKHLLESWLRFRDDDELIVAILHGAGDKSFCAGADLTALETLASGLMSSNPDAATFERYAQNDTGPMGGTRIVQQKPVITVSHGYTYAGGLELFCHGHIRIAEPQALFSVACRRWGVPLVDGGTVYLPRLLSWGAALPLIITGQRIRAERAYQIGLVWELTQKGRGLERALKLARQIAAQPRDALIADLSSVLHGSHLPLREALILEARNLYPVATSESMKKGVERFNSGERFWVV